MLHRILQSRNFFLSHFKVPLLDRDIPDLVPSSPSTHSLPPAGGAAAFPSHGNIAHRAVLGIPGHVVDMFCDKLHLGDSSQDSAWISLFWSAYTVHEHIVCDEFGLVWRCIKQTTDDVQVCCRRGHFSSHFQHQHVRPVLR